MSISWAYMRKGWTSCVKAQVVFKKKKVMPKETIEARKEKIEAKEAWEMLKTASIIFVGKGKKIIKIVPDKSSKSEILEVCLGRSGTLRAPTIKIKNTFIVGFNDELYDAHI